jgi:NAD(P)H-dependent FMN reductase
MNVVLISGSHREKSQSAKVTYFCQQLMKKSLPNVETEVVELTGNPLPLWDESVWNKDPKWNDTWIPIRDKFRKADAFVVVSPEWNGMVPAGLKNLFLFCSNTEMGHKPALIVAVSSGQGGAYPVVELRASGYKNTRICYIPDHVIVRHAEAVLNDADKPASKDDELIRIRLDYSLKVLNEYAVALKSVRASAVINFKDFASGM